MNHFHLLPRLAVIAGVVYLAAAGCVTIPIVLVVLLVRWGAH